MAPCVCTCMHSSRETCDVQADMCISYILYHLLSLFIYMILLNINDNILYMLFCIFPFFLHLIHLGDLFISVNKGGDVLKSTGTDLFSSPISKTSCQQKLEIGHGGIYPVGKCYHLATHPSSTLSWRTGCYTFTSTHWISSSLFFFLMAL